MKEIALAWLSSFEVGVVDAKQVGHGERFGGQFEVVVCLEAMAL